MRSLKGFNRYKFLNKWVKMVRWPHTYKCVGVGDKYLYLWYKGIHRYEMGVGDELFIIDEENEDIDYHSYNEVNNFDEYNIDENNFDNDNIIWIRRCIV